MFTTKSGENIFVVDGHTHLWDGSPANQKNIHGKQFIDCFYDYHHLGPDSYIWPKEKFERYTEEDFVKDVFEQGYADVAIFNHYHPIGHKNSSYALGLKRVCGRSLAESV